MIDGHLVIDAVAHAYDFTPGNRVDSCPLAEYDRFVTFVGELFHAGHEANEPDEPWRAHRARLAGQLA